MQNKICENAYNYPLFMWVQYPFKAMFPFKNTFRRPLLRLVSCRTYINECSSGYTE